MIAWIFLALMLYIAWKYLLEEEMMISKIQNKYDILLDNIYMNCKCNKQIPEGRLRLGFRVCVNCSTVEMYGCAPLINHKTGNSIQIMSSSDARKIAKLTRRKGYGTMLG
jgi:hypothetical protein